MIMCSIPRTVRRAFALAAAASMAAALAGCASTAIDAERSRFVAPPAIAARAAAGAELSLAHHQAGRWLTLGAAARPAASRGAFHEAYRRWMRGEVRPLPNPGQTVSYSGQE